MSVEKCLLLVYGLFENLKNLTFVMVRCYKTLYGAIYIYLNAHEARLKLLNMGGTNGLMGEIKDFPHGGGDRPPMGGDKGPIGGNTPPPPQLVTLNGSGWLGQLGGKWVGGDNL